MPFSVVIQPHGCECDSPDTLVHDVVCQGRLVNGFSRYKARIGPHYLGLILGPISSLDGWTAQPASRSYRPDITPQQIADPQLRDKWVGPPPIEGLKSRRYAIEYLLRAEGYWS